MSPIPGLSANFLLVPESYFDDLLTSNLGRCELLAALFMARRVFVIPARTIFFTVEEIAAATGLAPAELAAALPALAARGTIAQFDVDGAGESRYLLNTEDAAKFISYYDAPAEPPVAAPPAAAPPAAAPPVEAPPVAAPPPPGNPVEKALGRKLTKDEMERIEQSGATATELATAVDGVLASGVKLYTSDQVVYEHERRARKRAPEPALNKTRGCATCQGIGFLMSTKTRSIRVCDCKR